MTTLSVVIPVRDERDNLTPLYDRLRDALDPLGLDAYEVVFVDDGSLDGTFGVLESLARNDSRVKVVRLRRNFGQSAALRAGIDFSTGDVVATMDGDLQNDPRDLPALLAKLAEGYDAVLGERARRRDGFLLRKVPSWAANYLIRRTTGLPFRDVGCTLRAMRRELAEALPLYGEMHRFITVLAHLAGARLTQLPVRHHPRRAGRSKYNLSRTVRVLLDLLTVKFLDGYLARPMHFLGLLGLGTLGLGAIALSAAGVLWAIRGDALPGSPLTLGGVLLGVAGVQFLALGLLGEMQARTYFESQGKPAYAVRQALNLPEARPRRRRSKPRGRPVVKPR